MANTVAGFDGTLTETAESQRILRASEIGYRHGVWSGGVVTSGTGRAVNVSAIDGVAAGIYFTNDATSVALDANTGTNARIDYIVAEVSWTANTVTITKVTGTASASPVPPTLTQTVGTTWQMPLARVKVLGGASSILAANIEDAGPRRGLMYAVYRQTITADTMQGSATTWNTIATALTIPDPGRPYRLQVSATVRFNQTESAGYMRIRALNVDSNAVYGEGITPRLSGGRAAAVLNAQLSPALTGVTRVRLEMFPLDMSAGEQMQVLDNAVNHFTVLVLPA